MKKTLLILVLVMLVTASFAARKALIIGNSSYSDSPLRNPVNDARAVENLLKNLGFQTTLKTNLDRRALESAIDAFVTSLNPVDEAVFYYSGHGAQIEGENFLIPVGKVLVDETDVKYDAVSANKATDKLSRAALSIVILDACRDNPYKGARSANRGLVPMNIKSTGQYVIYSTASGQTASDGGSSQLSPFTSAFVKHANTDGITIEELMRNVVKEVRVSSNGNQIPFSYGSLEEAYFLARAVEHTERRISPVTPAPVVQTPVVPQSKQAIEIPGMAFVPGGTFTMGRTKGTGDDDEIPTRSVTLNSFYMGKYEVTQGEWEAVMGNNPSHFAGDKLPVDKVYWYELLVFCNKRSIAEGLSPVYSIRGSTDPVKWGSIPTTKNHIWDAVACSWSANGYRLPTEAEWEYAARGGSGNFDYLYSGSNVVNLVAWFEGNSSRSTQPVGSKNPNDLGLYDMSGNVWEWCWDWYGSYNDHTQSNPRGPASGSERVLRGGGWLRGSDGCRIANRNSNAPTVTYYYYGFRVCRSGL